MATAHPITTAQARCVSVEEATRRLGSSKQLAKRLVVLGKLPSVKLGARRLIPVDTIDRLINEAMDSLQNDA